MRAPAVLWALGLAWLGVLAWWAVRWTQRHQAEARRTARRLGLTYSATDRDELGSLALPAFRTHETCFVWDVFTGNRNGMDVRVFQFGYSHSSTPPSTGALTTLEIDAPELKVGPLRAVDRLADAMGMHHVPLESEAFARRYRVQARDERFAFDVLDARMMQWLLMLEGQWSFQMAGPNVLAFTTPQAKLGELERVLTTLEGFRAHLPSLIFKPR